MKMRVIKKLNAGKPGTKIYQHQYGENLLCIRHRKNDETGETLVTVEIVVQRKLSRNLFNLQAYLERDPDVEVLIGYEEHELRQKAKNAGARWDQKSRRWKMPYSSTVKLGLINRIVVSRD